MNKTHRYEIMYIKFSWAFIIIGLVNVLSSCFSQSKLMDDCFIYSIVFLAVVSVFNTIKFFAVKKLWYENIRFYFTSRIIELICITLALTFLDVGQWTWVIIVFPVMVTTLTKGSKAGVAITGCSFLVHLFLMILRELFTHDHSTQLLGFIPAVEFSFLFFFYLNIVLFTALCVLIYKDNLENEYENKRLLEQLGEKYEQLAVAQEEVKKQYETVKDTNIKLEDANKRLTGSVAEFFTLQQISQAIASILDIKELLKYVNDIIIGVMGVNNSTIILFDEKKKRLKVNTTTIRNQEELVVINDNVNCSILFESLENGKPIIENFVDPAEYAFTKGREVNSLMCIPLNTKSRKFGLVLIEHKYYNAFDENNLRLLDIIGQQVGFAMENAELYQKMQELATIDGLTGIYNRLYFNEIIQKEHKNAQQEQYELSLAIFDIDHFKKFNDTFGHLFGDKVLKSIVELVKGSMRSSDIFARFGGEEFIILFPRTSIKEAYEKIEFLREKISKTSIKDELVTANVTVSFGLSSYPEFAANEHDLIRTADDALYEAKTSGRNCVRLAKSSLMELTAED